jgi:beta-glucosidase
MTLEEKIKLCHGSGTFTVGNIPRLGIHKEFALGDNSSTVCTDILRNSWKGTEAGKTQTATAFPSLSALGATWDRALAYAFADALGKEARHRDKDMQLGPGVNIHRTPLCGRNWEYFGEDPAHASKMVVPYVKGLQKNHVAATVKHFVANNSEWGRYSVDVDLDERTLREIYLPAFEAAVKDGGAWAIMSGFNKVRGEFCSHHNYLNNQILKGEWGFKGLVVTDWGSIHDTEKGALGGTDLEMHMGLDIKHFKEPLLIAVKSGRIPEVIVDEKARRVLYVMAKTKFIGDDHDREKGAFETPEHTAIARKVAEDAVTLLKNDGNILPLQPSELKKVLVIGNNAIKKHCRGGGSARAKPKYEVSPLEGIKQLLGSGVEVMYHNVQSEDEQIQQLPETWIRTLDPNSKRVGLGQPAFKVEYFNDTNLSGNPVHVGYDKQIKFDKSKMELPVGVRPDNFSVRWSATISPDHSGEYVLGAAIDDGVKIFVDDQLVSDDWRAGGKRIAKGKVFLEKDKDHNLRVEYLEYAGAALCEFGLIEDAVRDFGQLAIDASRADAVIYFTGTTHDYETPVVESEGDDRKTMDLYQHDNLAIAEVLKAKPETIVVNLSGSAVSMPWEGDVQALVQYYFSGQEGGHAIANVLFGEVNPSGKLTFTIPKHLSDSPAHFLNDYNNIKMQYKEGVFVGYRWFDKKEIEPLFPFGHGLSYTTFKVDGLQLSKDVMVGDDTLELSVRVTNTGKAAGSEVVQLYVSAPETDVDRPVQELKDFGKVFLNPGESQMITLQVDQRDLAYWDVHKNNWSVANGKYALKISTSSRDVKQIAMISYLNKAPQ